jgi:23S rRNA (guanosine2251-2'-O)-methyltransferase
MSQQSLYGIHAIERVLKQAPQHIYRLVLEEGRLNARQQALKALADKLGVRCEIQPKSFFSKLDGIHQGVFAEVAKQAQWSEEDLENLVSTKPDALILFLDEVQDPHNLGAILRTADAIGVDAVVIPKNNSVGINATVRKVACGAADTVQTLVVTNLSRTINRLQQAGLWVIGLAGEAESTIYQAKFSGKLGLVMGAEGTGMRQLTRQNCDEILAIPMLGEVESLNVSVATAVTLYEIQRQRALF